MRVLVGGSRQLDVLTVLRNKHGFSWVSTQHDIAQKLRAFSAARNLRPPEPLCLEAAEAALRVLSTSIDFEAASDRYEASRRIVAGVRKLCLGCGQRPVPTGTREHGWWVVAAGYWPDGPHDPDLAVTVTAPNEELVAAVSAWVDAIEPTGPEGR